MEKVIISAEEFLSIYTGVVVTDMDTIYIGAKKVFGFAPFSLTLISCAEQFVQHINATRPDLAQAVKNTGISFDSNLSKEQVNELCEKFKAAIGDSVEVDKMTFEDSYTYDSESEDVTE